MRTKFTMMKYACCLALLLSALTIAPARAQDPALVAAAEKGDVAAQIQLGYGFRDGKFGAKDERKAFEYFSRAAQSANPEAVDNLAWLLEHGMGTPRDAAKARRLYAIAAAELHLPALGNLARCLREGLGGNVDTAASAELALQAWKIKRETRTAESLAYALIELPVLTPHVAVLEQLAEIKSFRVLALLAAIDYQGLGGLPKNVERARERFAAARKLGWPANMLDPFQMEELSHRPTVAGEFAYLTTRHVTQGYNLCAPASAAMALEFTLGKPFDQYAIKRGSTGATEPGSGTAWDCMLHGIHAVSGQTWTFRSWPNNDAGYDAGLPVLFGELDAGRVALIDLGPHTVVLCGYDAKARLVYINNPAAPWPGMHTVSYDELRQRWHSPGHVTTTRGIEARPVLLTRPETQREETRTQ